MPMICGVPEMYPRILRFSSLLSLALIGCVTEAGESPSPASGSGPVRAHLTSAPHSDLSQEVFGHWYLNRDGERLTLVIGQGAAGAGVQASIVTETQTPASTIADSLTYDREGGQLVLRERDPDSDVWYRLRVQDGVLTGRYARVQPGAGRPADSTTYAGQVTGWRNETFTQDIVPRVWDLTVDDGHEAVLRVDRASIDGAAFIGTLKMLATDGALDEQLSEDVQVESWDGTSLSFVRRASPGQERFVGSASGRTIAGTARATVGNGDEPGTTWSGQRIEVFSHGSGPRSAETFTDWQTRTRARLALLAMAGNPAPLNLQVTELGTTGPTTDDPSTSRDDDAWDWPQLYQLTELAFTSTVPNPSGGAPLTRAAHGYLSVPSTPPPAGGYPVAVALNGHGASARDVFDPSSPYWYGDSFARRGYVVISIDIGHRPLEDRAALYSDTLDGDDPATGNGPHPAIKAPGMTSEWEEDGERTWDAMRALDYALARPDVNQGRVTLIGLSMGGEVSDWTAAMDLRIGTTFSAGSPADLALTSLHGNHRCWMWQRADAREYLDPSDLHAMVAPRAVIRETGARDYTYSAMLTPFSAGKEVIRRAQPAFDALGGSLVHYIHFDGHAFHVGQYCPAVEATDGVTEPMMAAPDVASPWSTGWDADASTAARTASIFDLIPSP